MTARILAAVGNGVFILVATTVALRLLLLWRRTRQLPELLMGAGLLLPAAVSLPFMLASGIGGAAIRDLHLLPLAIGLASVAASVSLLMTFTWKVFRPSSAIAASFAVGTSVAACVVCVIFFRAMSGAAPDAAPIDVLGPHALAVRMLFEIWYTWMGVESLLEWSRARRRLALGLADPVVVNRFGLWGAMGIGLAFNGAVAMAFEAAGMDLMNDPLPAFWMALNGVVAGSLMYLAIVPPNRYLHWVTTRARHRRSAHATD